MNFQELRTRFTEHPLFTFNDVLKCFPETNAKTLEVQVHNWAKSGYLERVRKGLYMLSDFKVEDPFILADLIYFPSYISLESALNYYGLIPDIPFAITSVTVKKTATFLSKRFGRFSYRHVRPELFFGFVSVEVGNYRYHVSHPEKAVFDFLYLNQKTFSRASFPKEERFDFPKDFKWRRFQEYCEFVPLANKKFHTLKNLLIAQHAK